MITEIHQSSLNMALRCGEQFRRRYIENEIIPPGIAASRGIGVHKANHANLKQKIISENDLSLSDLQDATRDGYVNAFKNGVYIPKSELPSKNRLINEGLNDALRCTKVYQEEVAPQIQPISVEQEFKFDVGLDLPIAGRMDYQEKPKVGDLKTTSKKWQDDRIEKEIQVPFYSYVHEKEKDIRPEFNYHVLIARRGKDGRPTSEDYQPLSYTCKDNDYTALFAKLKVFMQMLKTGTFIPADPTHWICSSNYCGYFATCVYRGNPAPKREI